MKKILLLLLALLLILALPACEKDDVDTDDPNAGQESVDPDGGDGDSVLPDLDQPITLPEDIFE